MALSVLENVLIRRNLNKFLTDTDKINVEYVTDFLLYNQGEFVVCRDLDLYKVDFSKLPETFLNYYEHDLDWNVISLLYPFNTDQITEFAHRINFNIRDAFYRSNYLHWEPSAFNSIRERCRLTYLNNSFLRIFNGTANLLVDTQADISIWVPRPSDGTCNKTFVERWSDDTWYILGYIEWNHPDRFDRDTLPDFKLCLDRGQTHFQSRLRPYIAYVRSLSPKPSYQS